MKSQTVSSCQREANSVVEKRFSAEEECIGSRSLVSMLQPCCALTFAFHHLFQTVHFREEALAFTRCCSARNVSMMRASEAQSASAMCCCCVSNMLRRSSNCSPEMDMLSDVLLVCARGRRHARGRKRARGRRHAKPVADHTRRKEQRVMIRS